MGRDNAAEISDSGTFSKVTTRLLVSHKPESQAERMSSNASAVLLSRDRCFRDGTSRGHAGRQLALSHRCGPFCCAARTAGHHAARAAAPRGRTVAAVAPVVCRPAGLHEDRCWRPLSEELVKAIAGEPAFFVDVPRMMRDRDLKDRFCEIDGDGRMLHVDSCLKRPFHRWHKDAERPEESIPSPAPGGRHEDVPPRLKRHVSRPQR